MYYLITVCYAVQASVAETTQGSDEEKVQTSSRSFGILMLQYRLANNNVLVTLGVGYEDSGRSHYQSGFP